ncbi:MAG: hypothetical protein U0599_06560 [Vicinamibacteria bacterium]
MPSLLALAVAGAFALEPPSPPVEPPPAGIVGSVLGEIPSVGQDAESGEYEGPPFEVVAGAAAHLVLAEVVATHDVAGTVVEEAEVRLVLKGDPGTARVFYVLPSCGCGGPEKAKPGTPLLLFLGPGESVTETRRFWQALDRVAKPSEFFDVALGENGRLAADGDGLVETWFSLPATVPAEAVLDGRGRRRAKRVALDALVGWIQAGAAEAEQPLP